MRRLLILLLIGCIAVIGAELTKLHIRQEMCNQKEADLLHGSSEVILLTNGH